LRDVGAIPTLRGVGMYVSRTQVLVTIYVQALVTTKESTLPIETSVLRKPELGAA
jgi:hypothetical protein